MNRVFITGGSGFIGNNLVSLCRDAQIEVCNYDKKPPVDPGTKNLWREGDILDKETLDRELVSFKPDIFVHLAARCDLDGKAIEDYEANTTGVKNVISATRKVPSLTRVLFASSRYVHRNETQPSSDEEYSPFTMYGTSKVEGEKLVRRSDLPIPWLIFRPTSIWGPWFDVPYKTFFETVKKGFYIHPRGHKIYKSFGFVGNVVQQIKTLATAQLALVNQKTFYVADYAPVEIGAFADLVSRGFNAPPVRHIPFTVLKGIAYAGDSGQKVGWRNPPLTSFRLNNLMCQMVYDLGATENIVGNLPYSVEEGISKTVEWMRTR